MAQFRAIIRGTRGEASRLGSKASGIQAHVDGWNLGVSVRASVDQNGHDVFNVWATGGSNAATHNRLIATVGADGVKVYEGSIG